MLKKALSLVIPMLLLGMVLYFMYGNGTNNNNTNIEFIKDHCYNGRIVDLQNEITVKSEKDIKWYKDKRDTLVIEYGKITLKYNIKDFDNQEVLDKLEEVFITVKRHKVTKELVFYFQGKELVEYVKR